MGSPYVLASLLNLNLVSKRPFYVKAYIFLSVKFMIMVVHKVEPLGFLFSVLESIKSVLIEV